MILPRAQVTLQLKNFNNAMLRLRDGTLDQIVRESAFLLQVKAVERLTQVVYSHDREPTPTGALRASVYVRTYRDDTYRKSVGKARRLRAKRDGAIKAGAAIAPPVEKPGPNTAFVGVGVKYGIYIEYPTRGRPGTYYMADAAAHVRPIMIKRIRNALLSVGIDEPGLAEMSAFARDDD